jgi:hypothetical protein
MVTDPVADAQVGWVAVSVGATGVAGCGFMVMLVTAVQPMAFLAVTVCIRALDRSRSMSQNTRPHQAYRLIQRQRL